MTWREPGERQDIRIQHRRAQSDPLRRHRHPGRSFGSRQQQPQSDYILDPMGYASPSNKQSTTRAAVRRCPTRRTSSPGAADGMEVSADGRRLRRCHGSIRWYLRYECARAGYLLSQRSRPDSSIGRWPDRLALDERRAGSMCDRFDDGIAVVDVKRRAEVGKCACTTRNRKDRPGRPFMYDARLTRT